MDHKVNRVRATLKNRLTSDSRKSGDKIHGKMNLVIVHEVKFPYGIMYIEENIRKE
jgi:hypothetical protein